MSAMLAQSEKTELLVEYVGMLSLLNIPDFDYCKLVKSYHLLDFFCNTLSSCLKQKGNDDILLSVVVWIGNVMQDEQVMQLIAHSPLISILSQVMTSNPVLEANVFSQGGR
jgi:hypothetical protein